MSAGETGEFGRLSREPEETLNYDPIHEFIRLMPYLVKQARYMAGAGGALSYRKFHVGAALVGIMGDEQHSEIITGANYKPSKNSPKYCAEMDALDQAKAAKIERVTGMVIAGTSNAKRIKEVSDFLTPTLHPCGACREKMLGSEIVDADTLIVTVSLEEPFFEIFQHSDLELLYKSAEGKDTRYTHPWYYFNERGWGDRQELYEELREKDPLVDPARIARAVISGEVAVS